jgi:Tol biopolymer transport system component
MKAGSISMTFNQRIVCGFHVLLNKHRILLAMALLWLCMVQPLYAYNHPELVWRTFEGEHFVVHYYQGVEQTARQVYMVAERIYGPMTEAYHFKPKNKVHIFIRDHDDIANGASYIQGNKIEIWATSLNTDWRGTYRWLECVVTHEFAHTVSRGRALRLPPWLYAFTLQGNRNLANPDVRAVLPLATDLVPQWFSEGIAQFEDQELGHDAWDTQRDMLLRAAFREKRVLPYRTMHYFDKREIDWELVYNQGFSLTNYIAVKYGRDKISRLIQYSGDTWGFSFNACMDAVLGEPADSVYGHWYAYYDSLYAAVDSQVTQAGRAEGDTLLDRPWHGYAAAWSPDGKKVALLTSGRADYLILNLSVYDRETKKRTFVTGGVSPALCWSPDGTKLYYARMDKADQWGSHFNDVFEYTLATKKEERLTTALRATYPQVSPDGKSLVFVLNQDGTQRLGIWDLAAKQARYITASEFGAQYYGPRWSPDGKRIVVSAFTGDDRDLLVLDADGSNPQRVVRSPADERDPCWAADGKKLYFASDRTGIFNIHVWDADSQTVRQITNVTSGAFRPSLSPDEDTLAYSLCTADGFELRQLPETTGSAVAYPAKKSWAAAQPAAGSPTPEEFARRSHPYRITTPLIHFVPGVTVSDDKFKAGTEVFGEDVIGRQGLSLAAFTGQDNDLDFEGHYELNHFLPSLFLDFSYVKRNYPKAQPFYQLQFDFTNEFVVDSLVGDVSFRFDMYQFNAGAMHQLSDAQALYLFYTYKNFNYSYTISIPGVLSLQGSSVEFLAGHNLNLVWGWSSFAPAQDMEINPRGMQVVASYAYCAEATWDTLKGEYGESVYDTIFYNRFEVAGRYALPLPFWKHVLDVELSAGLIDQQVNSYFSYYMNFLVGGAGSFRSVPFYSLEGNRKILVRCTYRFPIWQKIDKGFAAFNFVRLYGGVFAEFGNAWNGGNFNYTGWEKWSPRLGDLKKGVGAELKLDGVSFYSYPMKIYASVARLLDRLPAEEDKRVYKDDDAGERMRYYLGMGFNY